MNNFSFRKGFDQVQHKDLKIVKKALMDALNIHNRTSWAQRLNGTVEPKASQIQSVEEVFKSFGITEVWGK